MHAYRRVEAEDVVPQLKTPHPSKRLAATIVDAREHKHEFFFDCTLHHDERVWVNCFTSDLDVPASVVRMFAGIGATIEGRGSHFFSVVNLPVLEAHVSAVVELLCRCYEGGRCIGPMRESNTTEVPLIVKKKGVYICFSLRVFAALSSCSCSNAVPSSASSSSTRARSRTTSGTS